AFWARCKEIKASAIRPSVISPTASPMATSYFASADNSVESGGLNSVGGAGCSGAATVTMVEIGAGGGVVGLIPQPPATTMSPNAVKVRTIRRMVRLLVLAYETVILSGL